MYCFPTRFVALGWMLLAVPLVLHAQPKYSPEGKSAKEWATLLTSKDVDQQRLAAFSLSKMGAAALPAVPQLAQVLQSDDVALRFYALRSLANCGPAAKVAIPGMIRLLEEDHPTLGKAAATTIARMGKEAVDPLAKGLQSENPRVRRTCLQALGSMGPEANASGPALAKTLKDESFLVRRKGAETLMLTQAQSPEIRAALLQAIQHDDDPEVRRLAAEALGKSGQEALPDLLRLLQDRNPDHRFHAAVALREIGPEAVSAVKPLAKMLRESEEDLRQAAADCLGAIGKKALENLLDALQDSHAETRQAAASGLAVMGKAADKAVEPLLTALDDKVPAVGHQAARALGAIGAAQAAPALARKVRHKDEEMRKVAALALVQIGKPAQAEVRPLLREKEARLRMLGVLVLAAVGGAEAVQDIAARLADEDLEVQRTAARSLGRIGSEAKAVLPTIRAARKKATDPELLEILRETEQSLAAPDARSLTPAP
jgi:HEAT repeat protein